jgi:hypothetical protein
MRLPTFLLLLWALACLHTYQALSLRTSTVGVKGVPPSELPSYVLSNPIPSQVAADILAKVLQDIDPLQKTREYVPRLMSLARYILEAEVLTRDVIFDTVHQLVQQHAIPLPLDLLLLVRLMETPAFPFDLSLEIQLTYLETHLTQQEPSLSEWEVTHPLLPHE